MRIEDFFELLFPGDKKLNVPSFRDCDDKSNVDGFLQTIPQVFIDELEGLKSSGYTSEALLKELKKKGIDLRPVINDVLDFYFSRSSVVTPLTGRSVPLTTSGMAKY
ncbi:MAG: hypothetical protein OQL20_02840 [Sedimenticola sp.]|nr:hypothetical protein [Sedimenticola sp.]